MRYWRRHTSQQSSSGMPRHVLTSMGVRPVTQIPQLVQSGPCEEAISRFANAACSDLKDSDSACQTDQRLMRMKRSHAFGRPRPDGQFSIPELKNAPPQDEPRECCLPAALLRLLSV